MLSGDTERRYKSAPCNDHVDFLWVTHTVLVREEGQVSSVRIEMGASTEDGVPQFFQEAFMSSYKALLSVAGRRSSQEVIREVMSPPTTVGFA